MIHHMAHLAECLVCQRVNTPIYGHGSDKHRLIGIL